MAPDQAGIAPVRLVVNSAEAARKALDKLGVKYTEEEVLAVRVSDRPGALGRLTRKLADHDINVKYAYGSIVKNACKEALIVLAVSDVAAAAKLVK